MQGNQNFFFVPQKVKGDHKIDSEIWEEENNSYGPNSQLFIPAQYFFLSFA